MTTAIVDLSTVPQEARTAMVVFQQVESTVASLIGPENAVTLSKLWLHCVRSTPGLQTCSGDSLAAAIMTLAELNLMPGQLGHVYLLPFKSKVTVIVGYKGFLELARRSGEIRDIVANVVYADELDSGKVKLSRVPAVIEHPFIPCAQARKDEDIVAAYCLITTKDGGRYAEILDRHQIESRRERSSSKHKASSPWNTDYARMARKSAVRALMGGGAVPMSTELRRAYEHDIASAPDIIDAGDVTPQAEQAAPTLLGALGMGGEE